MKNKQLITVLKAESLLALASGNARCNDNTWEWKPWKGDSRPLYWLAPFQGLECLDSPITGRCPVLMILPLKGIGNGAKSKDVMMIFRLKKWSDRN